MRPYNVENKLQNLVREHGEKEVVILHNGMYWEFDLVYNKDEDMFIIVSSGIKP